jgi:hypothetical protein
MISLRQKVACLVAAAPAGVAGLTAAMAHPHPSWLPDWLVTPLGLVSTVLLFFAAFVALWILSDFIKRLLVPKDSRDIPLIVWEWHVSVRRGLHFTAKGLAPIRQLIPLRRAAKKAYPKMRAVAPFNLRIVAAEENKPDKVLGTVAQMLLDRSTFKFSLFGVRLPSEEFAEIPEEDLVKLGISVDATSLCDQFQNGFDESEVIKYTKLAMKKCDLNRVFNEIGQQ